MMRTILLGLVLVLTPAVAFAQFNTTGTLSPNTTVVQGPTPATTTSPTPTVTGTTATNGATTVNGTTGTPGAMATGATATGATATGTTAGTAVARDAAIVMCVAEFSTTTGRLLVSSASTSAGVPTIAPGAPCAQALADLFVAGFGVIDVLPLNQQVQYTLVR